MKTFFHTAATLALVAGTAIGPATAAPLAAAANANTDCLPGTTAAAPKACSLPAYQWKVAAAYNSRGFAGQPSPIMGIPGEGQAPATSHYGQ
jgi:hypothetical protein